MLSLDELQDHLFREEAFVRASLRGSQLPQHPVPPKTLLISGPLVSEPSLKFVTSGGNPPRGGGDGAGAVLVGTWGIGLLIHSMIASMPWQVSSPLRPEIHKNLSTFPLSVSPQVPKEV